MSSAAVVIGALRVKYHRHIISIPNIYENSVSVQMCTVNVCMTSLFSLHIAKAMPRIADGDCQCFFLFFVFVLFCFVFCMKSII